MWKADAERNTSLFHIPACSVFIAFHSYESNQTTFLLTWNHTWRQGDAACSPGTYQTVCGWSDMCQKCADCSVNTYVVANFWLKTVVLFWPFSCVTLRFYVTLCLLCQPNDTQHFQTSSSLEMYKVRDVLVGRLNCITYKDGLFII